MAGAFGNVLFEYARKVKMTEHVEKGVKSFPFALQKMFSGGHIGKMLVDVAGGGGSMHK